ncbi:hypothetical protein [Methanobrevibacter sp.]|uniref:hypothetical protein n=1 Tax=Methanobrevibacter sp. TaxID=66852 RepID=UPI00388F473A
MLEPCELYLVTEDGQECMLPLLYNNDDTVTKDLKDMLKIVLIGSIFRNWIEVNQAAGKGQIPLSAVYINKFDENSNAIPVIDFQSTGADGKFDCYLTAYHQYKSIFDFYVDNNTNPKDKYKISCYNYYTDTEAKHYVFQVVKMGGDLRFYNANDELVYIIQFCSSWLVTLNNFLKGVKPYGENQVLYLW